MRTGAGAPQALGGPESAALAGAQAEPLDLARLYREHAEAVSRWARRLLGPDGDAEDVLHEVFLVAQRRLGDFRGEARVTTWLHAITVRVVQNHRRKQRRWRWWSLRSPPAAHPAPPPSTPLDALESRRAAEITYRLLDALPEAERLALILFEIEGLSGEEIAAVTRQAVGTVWVRLHRARAHFREAFAAWERRPPDRPGEQAARERRPPDRAGEQGTREGRTPGGTGEQAARERRPPGGTGEQGTRERRPSGGAGEQAAPEGRTPGGAGEQGTP